MTAEGDQHVSTAANQPSPARTRHLYWVLQVLVRLVPIVVVIRGSFELMFRNDWLLWNPYLEPGQIATLLAFVPAVLWAVTDGHRLVPTGQVVALWAAVGAAVVIQSQLYVAVFGVSQGMPLTVVEMVRWAGAALTIAALHAVVAGLLVLLGAGLYHLRNRRTTRSPTSSAHRDR